MSCSTLFDLLPLKVATTIILITVLSDSNTPCVSMPPAIRLSVIKDGHGIFDTHGPRSAMHTQKC